MIDWRTQLEAGETITNVVWQSESGGVTIQNDGIEGNRSTLLIGKSGTAKATATTSSGRTLVMRFVFASDEGSDGYVRS